MPLHLVKLCVGVDSIEDLQNWIDFRVGEMKARGETPEQRHTTRMIPRRSEELLSGGSLYWVIKGNIQVRQRLLDVRPFTDDEGVSRCHLVMEPVLHPTAWQPRRAFQGWRYLKDVEAPDDLGTSREGLMALPSELRNELAALGLL